MNIFQLKRRCALFISLSLMFPSYFLLAEPRYSNNISYDEAQVILEDSDNKYVYLGEDASNIYETIIQISLLDDNTHSPIHQLRKHIESGFSVGEFNAVGQALEYGASILRKKSHCLKKEAAKK